MDLIRLIDVLKEQIELERTRLHQIIENKGIKSKEALKQSQVVDMMINLLHRKEREAEGMERMRCCSDECLVLTQNRKHG